MARLLSLVLFVGPLLLVIGMGAACSPAATQGTATPGSNRTPGATASPTAVVTTAVPTGTPGGALGADYPQGKAAPDFTGIQQWLNSQPLSLNDLRGKVVLVDFWTYSCINCLRTLPYLQDWYRKYSGRGLVMVGVHSPEFSFEKDEGNVREAVTRLGVSWPVAMDNDMKTWNAYVNYFWPHKYLIDARGVIRYDHIGEGDYEKTEQQIQGLLAEAGYDVSGVAIGGAAAQGKPGDTTDEMYGGMAFNFPRWYGGDLGPVNNGTYLFADPGNHADSQFYLQGSWKPEQEYVQHNRTTVDFEDYVALKYTARSVFVVMEPGAQPYIVKVTWDGGPLPENMRGRDVTLDANGDTVFSVTEPRLYTIIQGPDIATHELKLYTRSDEFALYSFTFGG